MRNEKGITLVALILIIVVLLILAGISISLVVNNEANQVTITPNDQINTEPDLEAQYNMQEADDVNEAQDDLDNEELNNTIDEDVVNTGVDANTVSSEENVVQ